MGVEVVTDQSPKLIRTQIELHKFSAATTPVTLFDEFYH
jgi:hypothetical protein